MLTLAAVLIAVNWGVYIYAVNAGHVVEAVARATSSTRWSPSLLGVLVLRERLRRLQWVAVGVGFVAVVVLTVDYGHPPWIALVLAASFGALRPGEEPGRRPGRGAAEPDHRDRGARAVRARRR